MGYSSQVGIAIANKLNTKITEELALLRLSDPEKVECVDELLGYAKKHVDNKSGDVLYYFNWLKWDHHHNERPESVFINLLMDLDEEQGRFYVCIIGEELEDIQEFGSYYENPFEMQISRRIVFCTSHKGWAV